MKFTFRYQPLLRQRLAQEETCKRQLAQAMRKRQDLLNQLTDTQGTIRQSKHTLTQSLQGPVDLTQVGHFARYAAQTTLQGHATVRKLAELEPVIGFAQKQLAQAITQRKVLEKLREKHHEQWLAEQLRQETIRNDEAATQSHNQARIEQARRQRMMQLEKENQAHHATLACDMQHLPS